MGKQARQASRQRRGRHLQAQVASAEAVRAAWQRAWSDYAGLVNDFTREQLAEQGRTVVGVAMRPEDHHQVRHWAVDGTLPWRVDWPPYTYLPRNLLNSWLMRQCEWTQSADVMDLMMPVAQIGAALIGFDAAPVVARFDPDIAEAVMATPITGDLPVELLHRLPAWTVAIPMPWMSDDFVAFVTVDAATTSLDGVAIGDAGLDQLLIMFVSTDVIAPVAIELGAGSIAEQLARNTLVGNPDAGPTRLEPISLEQGSEKLGVDMPVTRLLEQTVALILYLCSEEPDITAVPTTVTIAPNRPRTGSAPRPAEVLDVGYRIGAALRTASSGTREVSGDGDVGVRRRPIPHLRRAHFHLYWYGPRNDPAARIPKIRWVAPTPVNLDAGDVVLTVRDVDRRSERKAPGTVT